MARFQFSSPDRRLTDGQNRLLNPASRMRARGNYRSICLQNSAFLIRIVLLSHVTCGWGVRLPPTICNVLETL